MRHGCSGRSAALREALGRNRTPDWLVSDVQLLLGMLDRGDELRERIEARKLELLAKYSELRTKARHETADARDRIRVQLDEVARHLRNGWDKLNDEVRSNLNTWLERRD